METPHKLKAREGGDLSGLREITSTTTSKSPDSQPPAETQEPPRRLHRKKGARFGERDRLTYRKAEILRATIRAAWKVHGIQAKCWIEVLDHHHGAPEFCVRSTLVLRVPKLEDAR